MQIALYPSPLVPGDPDHISWFIQDWVQTVASQHPEENFRLLSPDSGKSVLGGALPEFPGKTRWPFAGLRHDLRLKNLLEKQQAQVLLSLDGRCYKNIRIPILLLEPLPEALQLCLKKIAAFGGTPPLVICFSGYSAMELRRRCQVKAAQIRVIEPVPGSLFHPLGLQEKAAVQSQFSQGREYLVCTKSLNSPELLQLLKAFSLLKRKNRTTMKLLLTAPLEEDDPFMQKTLDSFYFSNDVVLPGVLSGESFSRILAASYAMIWPGKACRHSLPLKAAMASGVPSIVPAEGAFQEIAAGAALYPAARSPEAMAEKMELLYKDEHLRDRLVTAALVQASTFSLSASCEKLRSCLKEASGITV
jgi:glycosyltransferase involved in cell wall biosynthesis